MTCEETEDLKGHRLATRFLIVVKKHLICLTQGGVASLLQDLDVQHVLPFSQPVPGSDTYLLCFS